MILVAPSKANSVYPVIAGHIPRTLFPSGEIYSLVIILRNLNPHLVSHFIPNSSLEVVPEVIALDQL